MAAASNPVSIFGSANTSLYRGAHEPCPCHPMLAGRHRRKFGAERYLQASIHQLDRIKIETALDRRIPQLDSLAKNTAASRKKSLSFFIRASSRLSVVVSSLCRQWPRTPVPMCACWKIGVNVYGIRFQATCRTKRSSQRNEIKGAVSARARVTTSSSNSWSTASRLTSPRSARAHSRSCVVIVLA